MDSPVCPCQVCPQSSAQTGMCPSCWRRMDGGKEAGRMIRSVFEEIWSCPASLRVQKPRVLADLTSPTETRRFTESSDIYQDENTSRCSERRRWRHDVDVRSAAPFKAPCYFCIHTHHLPFPDNHNFTGVLHEWKGWDEWHSDKNTSNVRC